MHISNYTITLRLSNCSYPYFSRKKKKIGLKILGNLHPRILSNQTEQVHHLKKKEKKKKKKKKKKKTKKKNLWNELEKVKSGTRKQHLGRENLFIG